MLRGLRVILTLNVIRDHHPCRDGWRRLLNSLHKTLPDDDPVPLQYILRTCGLEDAVWCLRAVPLEDCRPRLFSIYVANRCRHLWTQPELSKAVETSFAYCAREVSLTELIAASEAAWATVRKLGALNTAMPVLEAARAACWATMWLSNDKPEHWSCASSTLWATNKAVGPSVLGDSLELSRLCDLY